MIYHSLKQRLNLYTTHQLSGESQLLRRLSTGAASPAPVQKPKHVAPVKKRKYKGMTKYRLVKKITSLGPTSDKVKDTLLQITTNGLRIDKAALIGCFRHFRKHGHYQHCLEILNWLETGTYDYSGREYALRLGLIYRLKGIDEVEKYYDGIPPDARNHYVYGTLLYCYCTEPATDKALALFKKMDEMNFASNVLAFNNLMCLYLKVGQPEKVPALVEEMKQRNIPLNNNTYINWIQSYRFRGDLEGVERVMHEVQEHKFVKDNWMIYSNVAAGYNEVGQSERAIPALKKLEDLLDKSSHPDREAYHHLISLYASTGKLESVTQAWDKLKSNFRDCNNLSYLIMVQALSIIGDVEAIKKYYMEWKSSYRTFDDRIAAVLIGAYLRHDMLEEAELLLKDVMENADGKVRSSHLKFMNYYLEKRQIDSALKHMEAAITTKWKPHAEKLEPFFRHFRDEKDVDGAEKLCLLLKKAQTLDANAYFWLLQTYAAAGKTAPKIRQSLEEEGVNFSAEQKELLQRVCPV